MPYRTWLFIAALGLILSASLGQAQEQAESTSRQADQEQGPVAPDIPTPFPVQIVEDHAAADARQRSEEEARQREIADLAAQEGMNAATQAMNRATQRMAEYGFWSTVFVAIGTGLLVITLVLTWMANRSAQAAVTVTRKIGEAQSRAYVHVQIANICGLGTPVPEVAIGVTNYGQTPARNVRFAARRVIGDYRQPSTLGDVEYRMVVDLGPSQSTTIRFPIDNDLVAKANASKDAAKLAFMIFGRIKYIDAFCRDDRETDFAFTTWHENEIGNCQLDTRLDGNRST